MSLRERARRAVQKEIAEAATALFVEHGYEATTVGDIAAAIGMSQRSVFRYFASKEEIVLGKFEFVGDDMIAALRARPLGEPVWTSLRHLFDVLVTLAETPGLEDLTEPIHRMVFETPTLLAGYLQRLQLLQEAVVVELSKRATYASDDPTPRALTAAAFGCLVAAQHAWLAAGADHAKFGEAIDRAMAVVEPHA